VLDRRSCLLSLVRKEASIFTNIFAQQYECADTNASSNIDSGSATSQYGGQSLSLNPEEESPNKLRQAAKAALLAGATEAFRKRPIIPRDSVNGRNNKEIPLRYFCPVADCNMHFGTKTRFEYVTVSRYLWQHANCIRYHMDDVHPNHYRRYYVGDSVSVPIIIGGCNALTTTRFR
jgi:hypothetical protein